MLAELKGAKTIDDLVKIIRRYFSNYDSNPYIPVLLKEGYFTTSDFEKEKQDNCSDFYAKLVLRPYNQTMKGSWQVNNLTQSFIDGSYIIESGKYKDEDLVYNIIVQRRLYGNNVYCFNPLLHHLDYIDEENYKNNGIVNAFYNDGNGKVPLIKKTNMDNLEVYKKAFEVYINEGDPDLNTYPKYILSVEFEYRNTINHIANDQNYVADGVYIKNVPTRAEQDFLWLIGTIDIPFVTDSNLGLNIVVNSFGYETQRSLNQTNYNDDTEAGLIVFNYECLAFLQKRYVVIGLAMVDTFADNGVTDKDIIIDTFEDIIVFWEGEFNKLPLNIKIELEQYNNSERNKGLISEAMFEWQLNGKWNFMDKATPFQRLGSYLLENHRELVLEYNCNVVLPKTIESFVTQANNIFRITKLSLPKLRCEELPTQAEQGILEIKTLLDNNKLLHNQIHLPTLFEFFCYLILNQVDKEYVRLSKQHK